MRILIVDRFPQDFLNELDRLGFSYLYSPEIKRTEILDCIADFGILIINSKIQVDRAFMDRAQKLRYVFRAGVGLDHIDLPYAKEKGIIIKNVPGGNADSVGEQTVGMLLALHHRLFNANRQVKAFQWSREENRATEIKGKTVGIIGYGHTGQATGSRLSGFGCKILVYDKYVSGFGHDFIEETNLKKIYEEADIISLHIPLTPETNQWANDEFFHSFQKPITFLNLSRGPIVDLEALMRAIDHGQVRAAALDVLPNERFHTLSEEEKKVYQRLFGYEQIILSPHVGGWSHESLQNINGRILDYIQEAIRLKKETRS